MIRVVLDTNVLVAAVISLTGPNTVRVVVKSTEVMIQKD